MRNWILAPEEARTSAEEGELTYIKGDHGSYSYLKTAYTGQSALMANIMIPQAADEPAPEFSPATKDGITKAELQVNDEKVLLAMQEGHAKIKLNEVSSNGRLTILTTNPKGQTTGLLTEQATLLTVDGKQILQTKEPVSIFLDMRDGKRVLHANPGDKEMLRGNLPPEITMATHP